MFAGLAVGAVVFVGAEPVDKVTFRYHILLRKYKRSEFAEPYPLPDGTTVITGESYNVGNIDHVWLRGKLAFVEAAVFLTVHIKLRLYANLVSLYVDVPVLVPVFRCYVFFGIDLSVIHKGNHVALFNAVAACFLARAGMGDKIKLKKIERRALADMACYTHLLLVHNLRVLFEFFCIVFHDEAPFIFVVRKGCSV